MKKYLAFTLTALVISSPGISFGQSVLTFDASAILGSFYDGSSDLNPNNGINLTYTLRAEDASIFDYHYGGEATFLLNTAITPSNLQVKEYQVYAGRDRYRAAFSNFLEPNQTPKTKLDMNKGLFETWQDLQPIDGAAAYSGAHLENTEKDEAALLLSGQWDNLSVFAGIGGASASEISFLFESNLGSFNLSTSQGKASIPAASSFGASLEIANSSISLAASQAPSQNKQTYGLKVVNEFPLTTLTLSAGADKNGLVTGFKQSAGLSLDFFIGSQGLLTFGYAHLTETSGSAKPRSYLGYNYTRGTSELIVGAGQDGSNGLLEVGVKFPF